MQIVLPYLKNLTQPFSNSLKVQKYNYSFVFNKATNKTKKKIKARSLVYWLGQKAHVQEVVGSNPAVYLMDVSDASYYIFNEEGNKGSQKNI